MLKLQSRIKLKKVWPMIWNNIDSKKKYEQINGKKKNHRKFKKYKRMKTQLIIINNNKKKHKEFR